ncbi:hypothetical protein Glove_219g83 [Diversispora epigaea]|uniref:Glycosyltransferase family 8 protein n=1 Tax=Diversispora epigaea TaxID=1348612 RepID=A0A397IIV4_9GLOM|nr:hypothetical protein Glove_219g83 [Diversispora epigaea]
MASSKKTWVTLLTTKSYLKGVQCLVKSLTRVNSVYPLVVLIPNIQNTDLTKDDFELLNNMNNVNTQEIEIINPLNHQERQEHKYIWDYYKYLWTKIRVWELIEYEKAIFLDADMLLLKNIDELMNFSLSEGMLAAAHACTCNPRKIPTYPAHWIPENCAYTKGPQAPESADMPPKTSPLSYFNSGLLVLIPSIKTFNKIYNHLINHPNKQKLHFADQDLLNEVFENNWKPLPYTYNALKTLKSCHALMWQDRSIRNIHYILNDKPWKLNIEEERMKPKEKRDEIFLLNNWWWKVFNDEIFTDDDFAI